MRLEPTKQVCERGGHCRIGLPQNGLLAVVLDSNGIAHRVRCRSGARWWCRRSCSGRDEISEFCRRCQRYLGGIHLPWWPVEIHSSGQTTMRGQCDLHDNNLCWRSAFISRCYAHSAGRHPFFFFNALIAVAISVTCLESISICFMSATYASSSHAPAPLAGARASGGSPLM